MVVLTGQEGLGKVILIDETGENKGEETFNNALDYADGLGLDLVQMKAGNPSICKVMDYSKHKYEQSKRKRKNKSVKVRNKEIQLSLNIGEHDMKVKAKNLLRNIERGNKVRAVLILRGRENSHADLGKKVLGNFVELVKSLKEDIEIEKGISKEGNRIVVHFQ